MAEHAMMRRILAECVADIDLEEEPMAEVKVWERVQPGDRLLRYVLHDDAGGETELVVVKADGEVTINWPAVEKLGALPPPTEGRLATGWATACMLLHARDFAI
jgi:hypothetical protein